MNQYRIVFDDSGLTFDERVALCLRDASNVEKAYAVYAKVVAKVGHDRNVALWHEYTDENDRYDNDVLVRHEFDAGWSDEKKQWVKWVKSYDMGRFFDSFLATVEGAESTCRYCGQTIRVDITVGGGVPDWSFDGDFGCDANPDSDDEGTGGHLPIGVGEPM